MTGEHRRHGNPGEGDPVNVRIITCDPMRMAYLPHQGAYGPARR